MPSYDAVVVGAGPNGLVAANRLVDAGWSVLLLEDAPEVGGAVQSHGDVHPGFVHDTFSSFYPLAAASAAIQSFRLEEHGLVWRHAPAVLGHVRRDGSWALLHRDRELTAKMFDDAHPGDGESWLELCRLWDRVGDQVIQALLTPFPPMRAGAALLARLPKVGGLGFVRTLLTPVADPTLWPFTGDGPRLLLAGNGGHSDIPLHAPGSGLMGVLMTMLGQTVGFPVPQGGAGRLSDALARRLRARGGEVRCNAPARRIVVDHGRAVAVEIADGTRVQVRRAVVAGIVAPLLFGRLLAPDDVPAQDQARDAALPVGPGHGQGRLGAEWTGPVAGDSGVRARHGARRRRPRGHERGPGPGRSDLVPAKPFLLAGQMTTTDSTRSPDGTESMWAYTHVPREPAGDAGDDQITGLWDHAECERFADRIQSRIEARAPGFGERILARRVLGPRELEARNANLDGGSINGGTSQLHQQLVFRPVPGLGRAETGIRGLYLGSSSAHPGGGVHGAPGMNAARAALAHDRLRWGHR